MPVSIPAGTKFEAIKPTTNVNRRSALVNANDLTYTIEDIAAAAGGGGFTITNNYIPRGNALGSIVDSNLYQDDQGFGTGLFGDFAGGIGLTTSGANLLTLIADPLGGYSSVYIGDIFGSLVSTFGLAIDSNPLSSGVYLYTNGINLLSFSPPTGNYDFGGVTTRFGISDADIPTSSIFFTPDLLVSISGTDYIKVNVGGTSYKIALVP